MGLIPVAVTQLLDIASVLSKEFLEIQTTTDYRFTLNSKRGCDMIKTQNHGRNILLLFGIS